MIFLNPTVLLGLLAAGIPILIHLLNLRKLKKIDFSTLSFLKELQKTKIRKIKMKQWLLLLLRVLLILFLVLSFSRPTLESADLFSSSSKAKLSAVFILDNSASMSLTSAHGSNFNKSKEIIKNLVSELEEGDEALILSTASPKSENSFSTNKNLLLTEIDLIDISTAKNNLEQQIKSALESLNKSSNLNKEIYLFTDLQEYDLSDNIELEYESDPEIRFYVFNNSNNDVGNLSVDQFQLNNQLIEKEKSISFSALVSNSSQKSLSSTASLFINGKRSAQRSVSLSSQESDLLTFETTLKDDGLVTAKVVLDDDDLLTDNEMTLGFFVPKTIKVLLLFDDQKDITFLEIALQNELMKNRFSIEKLNANNVYSTIINNADVIVYVGEQKQVADLLKNGKSQKKNILYFPPSNSIAKNYNEFLKAVGLTNQFTNIKLSGSSNNLQFDVIDFEHPIFNGLFEDQKKAQIISPEILNYYRLVNQLNGKRIISLVDKSPLLYEFVNEEISLVSFGISPVISWSSFPLTGIFAPIIVRSINYLSSSNSVTESVYSLEELSFNSDLFNTNLIEIENSSGKKDILNVDSLTSKRFYIYNRTNSPGIYKVYDNRKLITAFSVNHNPIESNLTWVNEESFTNFVKAINQNVTFIEVNENYKEKINQTRFGTELWRYFLILALITALFEMIISRNTKKDIAELN